FFFKAFKISSLSYQDDFIFIGKLRQTSIIPFENVMEIKREKATVDRRGPMSFGYRLFYRDENKKNNYSIVFIRTDRIPNLENLAKKIKTVNPDFTSSFEDDNAYKSINP